MGETFQQPAAKKSGAARQKNPLLPQRLPEISGMSQNVIQVSCQW
jgi:hypothetical protein